MKEVITTKDLREMCQNGVTLDDLRRLYGVYATLEDLELIMPSRLIDNLGVLPWSKVDLEISESQEGSQDKKKEEFSPGQDASEEKVSTCQDKMGDEMGSSQTEKSESTGALLSSKDQQAEREIEPQASSFYNLLQSTVSWHPLFALCFLPQTSNMLDILTSLEIWSQLT